MPRNNKVDYDRFDICKLTDIRKTEFFSSSTESKLLNSQMRISESFTNYDRRYKNSDDCKRRSRSRTREQGISSRHFSHNVNIQKKIDGENYTYKSNLRDDYQHRRNSRPVSKNRVHSTAQLRRRSDSNGSDNCNDNVDISSSSKRDYQIQKSSRVLAEDASHLENHKPIFNKSRFYHSKDKNDSKRSAYEERELNHGNVDDHKEHLNYKSDFYSSSKVIVHQYEEFCRSISRNSLNDDSNLPHKRKVSEQRESFDDRNNDKISNDPIFRPHTNESNLNERENSYQSNYEPVSRESIENVGWPRKNRIEKNSDRLLLNDDSYLVDKAFKDEIDENQYRQDYKSATRDGIEDDSWSRQQRIGINFDRPQPSAYFQSSKNINDERIDYGEEDINRKYDEFNADSYVRNTRWKSRSRSRDKQTNNETLLHSTRVNTGIINSVKNQDHDFRDRIFHGRNEPDLNLNKYENLYQQNFKLRDGLNDIWQKKQTIEANSNVLQLNDNSGYFPRGDKNVIEEKIDRCDIDRKYNAFRTDSAISNRLNENDYNLNLENYGSIRRENPYQKKYALTPKDEIEKDLWPGKQRKEINVDGPQSNDNRHYFPRCDTNVNEEKVDRCDIDRKYNAFRTDSAISNRLNENDYNLNLENYGSDRRDNPYQKKYALIPKDDVEKDSWPGKQRKEINFDGPQLNDNRHYFPPNKNEQNMDIDDRKCEDIDDRKYNDIDDRKYKEFSTNYSYINNKQTGDYQYQRTFENTRGRSSSRSKESMDSFKKQISNETLNRERFKMNDTNAYQNYDPDLRDGNYLFGKKFEDYRIDFDKGESDRKYNVFEPNSYINDRQSVSREILSKSDRLSSRERSIKEFSPSNSIRLEKRKIDSDITDGHNYLNRFSEPRFKRHRSNFEELQNRNISTDIEIIDLDTDDSSATSARYDNGTYRQRESDLYSQESQIGNTEIEICDQKEDTLYKAKSNYDFEGLNYWFNFFKTKSSEDACTVWSSVSSKNKQNIEIYCNVCNHYYNSVAQFQIHTASEKHFKNEAETFSNNPPPPIIVKRSPLVVQDILKHFKKDTETFSNIPPPPVIVKRSPPMVRDPPKHFRNDTGTFSNIPPPPVIRKSSPPVIRDVLKHFRNDTETFSNIPPPPVIRKSSPPVVLDINKKHDTLKHNKIEHVNDTKPESWKVVKENKVRQILETSLYTGRSNVIFDDLYRKFNYFATTTDKDTIILKCNLCDLFVYAEQTFTMHAQSKRHIKALRNYRGKAPLPTVNKRKVVRFPTGLQCDICEQYCFESVQSLNQHMISNKHKMNFKNYLDKVSAASTALKLDKSNNEEIVETATVDQSSKATINEEQKDNPTDNTFYYCSICDLTLNSLQQYDSHLTSKSHANKKRMVENLIDE